MKNTVEAGDVKSAADRILSPTTGLFSTLVGNSANAGRYIVPFGVSDHTGQIWVQAFNEIGEQIFGRPANDLHAMQAYNEREYKDLLSSVLFKEATFKCRAKQESYQSETKIRYSVMSMIELDYAEACRELFDMIEVYRGAH